MPSVTINLPRTTFVSSALPDNNFSFYPLLYTGTDTNFGNCISLLEVDLPALPVPTVDKAVLQLSVIVKSGEAPSPVTVSKVLSPFSTATVSYNTKPVVAPPSSQVNVTTDDLFKTVEIDVTSIVNEWLARTGPNHGIALANDDGTTIVQFATNNIVYEPYFPKMTLTWSETPVDETNFGYAQLAHVIKQLITLYPGNTFTVYTRGFSGVSVTGTPVELFRSSSGTYGTLFILGDAEEYAAIPLNTIAAIRPGEGSVYNPAITYLTPQDPVPGFDTNLLSAYHEYIPVSTEVELYMGTVLTASGMVYRNEYGIIVLANEDGSNPLFVPVYNINIVVPKSASKTASVSEVKIGTTNVAVEIKKK
jgi:hypothetical protein